MYKVVVVGTDGSATADKAVEMAAALARPLGAHLHIVTAYKSGPSGIAGASGVALIDSGVGHAVAEETSKGVVDRAAETYGGGLEVTTHVLHDDPADAILGTATRVGADLVVVGSKGMKGAARRIIGSVPNSVAHGAHCAVLIAKTD
jgi:nucleotide-binding universal stress UspA family protein